MLGERRVMVVGTQKGRDTKENIKRNFGCAHPEGYRKALRIMGMANRFGLPIVCLIDTAGAYPGVAAEERHIAKAIAINLRDDTLQRTNDLRGYRRRRQRRARHWRERSHLDSGKRLLLRHRPRRLCCHSLERPRRCSAGGGAEDAPTICRVNLVDKVVPEPLGSATTITMPWPTPCAMRCCAT